MCKAFIGGSTLSRDSEIGNHDLTLCTANQFINSVPTITQ
jgi:hypothetical protein